MGELDSIALKKRQVVIAYDSDVMEKKSVMSALLRFAGVLRSKGAIVQVLRWGTTSGAKVGIDDFLASGGTVAQLEEMVMDFIEVDDADPPKVIAQVLVDAAIQRGLEYLKGLNDQQSYVSFAVSGVFQSHQHDSAETHGYLYHLGKEIGTAPSQFMLREACHILNAFAKHEGATYPCASRIWGNESGVYLYLADDEHRIIHIRAGTWGFISPQQCPVRFVKRPSSKALPEPTRGEKLDSLATLLNVDEESFWSVRAYLIGCFLSRGELPVLLASGEQGSGKTLGSEFIRNLIDPKVPALSKLSKDPRDLIASVRASYLLCYDNISQIPAETSDDLCRITSGVGFSARALFTNADEVFIEARNPIIITAIGDPISRGDLADRSIPVHFKSLGGSKLRRSRAELETEFRTNHGRWLGALLDLVAIALKNLPRVREMDVEWPRLIDFAQLVTASEPLEHRGRFLSILGERRREGHELAIGNDPIGPAIKSLIDQEQTFRGSATELLRTLNAREGVDMQRLPMGWPKNATGMATRLQRLAPSLRNVGMSIDHARTGKGRSWFISSIQSDVGASSASLLSFDDVFEPDSDTESGVALGDTMPSPNSNASPAEQLDLSSAGFGDDAHDANDTIFEERKGITRVGNSVIIE
jgi:hypothetical protein